MGGSPPQRRRAVGALAVLLGACGSDERVAPVGAQLGPSLAAAVTAADGERAPWRCAAPDGPDLAKESVVVGEATWELQGHTMTWSATATAATPGKSDTGRTDPRPVTKAELVIGVVADAAGATPSTLAAIGRLRTALDKADLVLALGGMGTTRDELATVLTALGERAPFPLVVLPGDLESTSALAEAIAQLRAKSIPVIDGRLAQRIVMPGATLALVPGASAPSRLVAGDEGCVYTRAGVDAAAEAIASTKGLRILASAEAPRGETNGEPTGDLAITVTGKKIDIALHGPMTEAPSRAQSGGRDGDAIALTPGSLDTAPRLPTPVRPATAGLLTIRGAKWAWKPLVDAPE